MKLETRGISKRLVEARTSGNGRDLLKLEARGISKRLVEVRSNGN